MPVGPIYLPTTIVMSQTANWCHWITICITVKKCQIYLYI